MTVRVKIEGLPAANPTPYNEDAFLEASREFQYAVGSGIDALWEAGASPRDIESEIANAVESTEAVGED